MSTEVKFVCCRPARVTFLLLTVAAVLQGCSSTSIQGFYVEGASRSAIEIKHPTASGSSNLSDPMKDAGEFLLSPHVIDAGRGSVLAVREFYSAGPLGVDSSGFLKVTISIPVEKLATGEFKVGGQVRVNLSTGNSNSPGASGCAGWAEFGLVSIVGVEQERATIDVDVSFDKLEPVGIQRNCPFRHYVNRFIATKKLVGELSYWEGKASPTLIEQAYPK
jgi:hypothetical protein